MSVKLARRVAADIMGRGLTAVKIHPNKIQEAEKAITRDDVRKLISDGSIYALESKHNQSLRSFILKKKRAQGRRRGTGRKRGTVKARAGTSYQKKIRGQRRVLAALKEDNTIDNAMYKGFYKLVRGGIFVSKASLISHMKSKGVNIPDERAEKLRHI